MIVVSTKRELLTLLKPVWKGGKKLGFVPTMGSLHKGHLSLIERSVRENQTTLVSIFVNPSQFNDKQDLLNYPREDEKDKSMLSPILGQKDIVFMPDEKEMYPEPDNTNFNFGKLDKILEGAHRKGHFNGVAQIVKKLFELIKADNAYFGEKDLQQLMIVRKLAMMINCKTSVIACPIVRENDGLAMSSRNKLLNKEQRKEAAKISAALFEAYSLQAKYSPAELKKLIISKLETNKALDLEYFEIADGYELQSLSDWNDSSLIYALIAVKIGPVRLIDNYKLVDNNN